MPAVITLPCIGKDDPCDDEVMRAYMRVQLFPLDGFGIDGDVWRDATREASPCPACSANGATSVRLTGEGARVTAEVGAAADGIAWLRRRVDEEWGVRTACV